MPLKSGKGYGPKSSGRTQVGGNTAQNTGSKRTGNIGGNTANMGNNKGQQHIYEGGNYAKGQPTYLGANRPKR